MSIIKSHKQNLPSLSELVSSYGPLSLGLSTCLRYRSQNCLSLYLCFAIISFSYFPLLFLTLSVCLDVCLSVSLPVSRSTSVQCAWADYFSRMVLKRAWQTLSPNGLDVIMPTRAIDCHNRNRKYQAAI